MKKLLLALLFSTPLLASAQHYNHFQHYHRPHWQYSGDRWNWMVPALIGGVIVYEASKQPPPTVVIQQQPVQENCTAWTETQTPDGRVYRERTCTK